MCEGVTLLQATTPQCLECTTSARCVSMTTPSYTWCRRSPSCASRQRLAPPTTLQAPPTKSLSSSSLQRKLIAEAASSVEGEAGEGEGGAGWSCWTERGEGRGERERGCFYPFAKLTSLLVSCSCQCEFRLECLQDIPVERVSFKLAEGNGECTAPLTLPPPSHHHTLTLSPSHHHSLTDDFCLFSWDSECLQTLVPLSKEQVGAFLMTISARIPSWFRVLNDQLTTGVSKPAYFHHHGNISASTISSGGGRASFQSFESPPALGGGSSSPHSSTSYDSTSSSPTLSPVAKRPRNQTNLHVASSASSEGSEQRNALVESLDLDHPAFSGKSKRHSNSATLPHSGCSSPVETQKRASTLQRTPKINRKNVVGARDNLGEFDYDKVFFPDDKRASIRSDPGDRTRPPLSGTRHSTSARSRKQKVATGLDVTNSKPMSVPRNEARLASQYGGSPILETAVGASSSSSGKPSTFSVESEIHRPQGKFITPLTRSTATRNQSTSARKPSSSISKGLISTPFGPLFKEVPRAPSETKVVGRFSIEYSGGAGGREGYCRSTETSVTVFVRPALVFERFEISGIEG